MNSDRYLFVLLRASWITVAFVALLRFSGLQACELNGDVVTVVIRSSLDDTPQQAHLYVPPNNKEEAQPLVVSLHSWSTNYRKYDAYEGVLRGCKEREWVFLSPDFRGSNTRPEACASDLAVQDVLDAVAYAMHHAKVDSQRIYLIGGSGGGHMALTMAHRAPKMWNRVSAWVAITDLTAWHAYCKSHGVKYQESIEQSLGGPPNDQKRIEEYRRRSPLFWLSRAKSLPIDIQAGIHDRAVPIDQSMRAFNVLAAANGHSDKLLSEPDIRTMADDRKIPDRLRRNFAGEPGRSDKILFRRVAGPVRITIFDGGHIIDTKAAMQWFDE